MNIKRKKKSISQYHSNKLGSMQICRGSSAAGDLLYSWDVIGECVHDSCPSANICPYIEKIEAGGECKVMHNYIRAATMELYQNQKSMTSAQRYQIGMHVMPLYRALCRMKIEEAGVRSVLYRDEKGIFRINPLFKEIRETIKSIDAVWKSIGVKDVSPPAKPGDFSKGFPEGTSYYDAMEKEALGEMEQ